MYTPSHFAQNDPAALQSLMREYPLATLMHAGAGVLTADPVPLMYDAATSTLRGHVARANPLWREAAGQPVLAVFHGPQAYVSPSWYAAKAVHHKVVPTWNYAIVQAHGRLAVIDDAAWLRDLVGALTDAHEAAQPTPWHVTDAPDVFVQQMLRAIVGIQVSVERLEGKWKLSQNRDIADREGVVRALGDHPAAGWIAR